MTCGMTCGMACGMACGSDACGTRSHWTRIPLSFRRYRIRSKTHSTKMKGSFLSIVVSCCSLWWKIFWQKPKTRHGFIPWVRRYTVIRMLDRIGCWGVQWGTSRLDVERWSKDRTWR